MGAKGPQPTLGSVRLSAIADIPYVDLGVSRQAVRAWQAGRARPSAPMQELIERLLGIDRSLWLEPAAVHQASVPLKSKAKDLSLEPRPIPPPSPADVLPGRGAPRTHRVANLRTNEPGTEQRTAETTIGQIDELLSGIRRSMNAGGLLPNELSRLRAEEGKFLALRAKLEREEQMVENRVVRSHPAWKRLRDSIVNALRPFPEALEAVIGAIEQQEAG